MGGYNYKREVRIREGRKEIRDAATGEWCEYVIVETPHVGAHLLTGKDAAAYDALVEYFTTEAVYEGSRGDLDNATVLETTLRVLRERKPATIEAAPSSQSVEASIVEFWRAHYGPNWEHFHASARDRMTAELSAFVSALAESRPPSSDLLEAAKDVEHA